LHEATLKTKWRQKFDEHWILCTRQPTLKMIWRVCKGIFHLTPASICLGIHGNLSHMSQKSSQWPPVVAITLRHASMCFTPCVHEQWNRKFDAFCFSRKFFQFISLKIHFLWKFRWTELKLIDFTKILNYENLEPYGIMKVLFKSLSYKVHVVIYHLLHKFNNFPFFYFIYTSYWFSSLLVPLQHKISCTKSYLAKK